MRASAERSGKFDRAIGGRRVVSAISAVHFLHDRVDLLLDRQRRVVERLELGGLLREHREDFSRERLAALASFREHLTQNHAGAELLGVVVHHLELGVRVGAESVDGDHDRQPELPDVLQVVFDVRQPPLERTEIFLRERLLVRAALHLE